MLVGVVSDTHNNVKNIQKIINIFNEEKVQTVIHTGDISNSESLRLFSKLNCSLVGVFGNNDRMEKGLKEVCNEYNFSFQEPPLTIVLRNRKIIIFHEPDLIKKYVKKNNKIDFVIHGHTHRYREEIIAETTYFNPGESAGFLQGKSALGIINLKNMNIRRIFF